MPSVKERRRRLLETLNVARELLEALATSDEVWQRRYERRRRLEQKVSKVARKELREAFKPSRINFRRLHELLFESNAEPRAKRAAIRTMIRQAIDVDRFKKKLARELGKVSALARFDTMALLGLLPDVEPVIKQIEFPVDVESWIQENAEIIASELGSRLREFDENLADEIADAVMRAADPASPQSVKELQKLLIEEYGIRSAQKAEQIARTETAFVYGMTTKNTYKELGVTRMRWVTAAGSPAARTTPVCQRCAALAAEAWQDINANFEASYYTPGGALRTINAPFPPYHPYCRCDIVADIESLQQDVISRYESLEVPYADIFNDTASLDEAFANEKFRNMFVGEHRQRLMQANSANRRAEIARAIAERKDLQPALKKYARAKQMKNLDDAYAIAEDLVEYMSYNWNLTSDGPNQASHTLQETFAQLFGARSGEIYDDWRIWDITGKGILEEMSLDEFSMLVRAYGDEVYRVTQLALEEVGYGPDDYVLLMRGMRLDQAPVDKVMTVSNFAQRPLNSYSYDIEAATMFGVGDKGILLVSPVKRKMIFGMNSTGIGTRGEAEVVVMGVKPENYKGIAIRLRDIFPLSDEPGQFVKTISALIADGLDKAIDEGDVYEFQFYEYLRAMKWQ